MRSQAASGIGHREITEEYPGTPALSPLRAPLRPPYAEIQRFFEVSNFLPA